MTGQIHFSSVQIQLKFRLALACTDTNEELAVIKEVETEVTQLWKIFDNSPKKLAAYLKVQEEMKQLREKANKRIGKQLKKACKTRWLSFDNAIAVVCSDLPSILQTNLASFLLVVPASSSHSTLALVLVLFVPLPGHFEESQCRGNPELHQFHRNELISFNFLQIVGYSSLWPACIDRQGTCTSFSSGTCLLFSLYQTCCSFSWQFHPTLFGLPCFQGSQKFWSITSATFSPHRLISERTLVFPQQKNSGDDDEVEFCEGLSVVPIVASSGLQLWP